MVFSSKQQPKYKVGNALPELFFSLFQTACKHNISIEVKTVCYKANQQQKKLMNI